MKSALFLTLFSLIALSNCNKQNKHKTDLEELNLKDKVKSIKTYNYEAIDKFGNLTKGKKVENIFIHDDYKIFNTHGNVIEENYYHTFGGKGKLTFKTGTFTNKITYDKTSKKAKEIYYINDTINMKTVYFYNEKGNKIEEFEYEPNGNLTSKKVHIYDNKGNKTEENKYNSNGNLTNKVVCLYDKNGNKQEEHTYLLNESDSTLFINNICIYDDKENKTEEKNYYSDGSSSYRYTFSYDNKNNLIEKNDFDPDGSLAIKETYSYDDLRNEIEYYGYANGILGLKKTYQYTFDKYGNWVKKIHYENDFPKYIIERQIEYYK